MSNDNSNYELASAPVKTSHRFLTLAGAVVLGFVLGAPGMLILLMAIPGNCESSPGFCSLWEFLGLLVMMPLYLGIAGCFLAFKDTKGKAFSWIRRLCILCPLAVSIFLILYVIVGGN